MTFLRTARNLAAAAPLLFPISASLAKEPSKQPAYIAPQPQRVSGKRQRPREEFGYDRIGAASWYGRHFHGRRTASGERYDMNALTAAHPSLPLSTMVRVTNLENGLSVVVRVNDRGPRVRSRIIDLSQAAARTLGFAAKGVARVRVTALGASSWHRVARED